MAWLVICSIQKTLAPPPGPSFSSLQMHCALFPAGGILHRERILSQDLWPGLALLCLTGEWHVGLQGRFQNDQLLALKVFLKQPCKHLKIHPFG